MTSRTLSIGLMATCINKKYQDQIRGCEETWVKDANKLGVQVRYFVGTFVEPEFEKEISTLVHLPGVGDDYASASNKQWSGLAWMLKHTPADYYLLGGSDNYVEIERLLALLQKYDPAQPFVIGGYGEIRQICGYQAYMPFGGCGIIFTQAALAQTAPKFPIWEQVWKNEICVQHKNFINACDLALGHFVWQEGIPVVRERELYPCRWEGAFVNPNWDYFHVGGTHFDKIVTCHYMEREDMHRYRHYRCRVEQYVKVKFQYIAARDTPSDINTQLPQIYNLAQQCGSVLDGGLRFSAASWALLKGLADNDRFDPHEQILVTKASYPEEVKQLMGILGIKFQPVAKGEVDLLFLSGCHCCLKLKNQLESYCLSIKKQIVVHINPTCAKSGLSDNEVSIRMNVWRDMKEFVNCHPEWSLKELSANGGLNILERRVEQ